MRSKIARKLTLYFALALLLFCAVIGAVFISLFRAKMVQEQKNEMEARAVSIAASLADFMGASGGGGFSAGSTKGGYGSYLRFIDEIAMTDVWIVDEDLNLITAGKTSGRDYNFSDLPPDAGQVVEEVFVGKTTFSEGFSSLLSAPTLTVGTPIESGGIILGAVLLHSPVEGINDTTAKGVGIFVLSALSALIISVLLSIFLALTFTRPLNKMKKTALTLAEGDYSVKTDVLQNDEIGELAGSIDILSERLLEAKLAGEKLDMLRRDFISNVSHELKTPVTVIRGSLEALYDEVVTAPAQIKEYYRQMLSESLVLQRLISDLLDLSKLQNPDFKTDTEKLNLREILDDAVKSANHLAKAKNIEIDTESDTVSHFVTGDYGRLRQMFLIVLDNSVKFSPAGGVIRVSLSGGTVAISDNGRGIAKEDLPYIFDKFYRTESDDNRSGSGLGLAIAKQIADRHGIAIIVSSPGGQGTMLRFVFDKIP